MAGTATVDDYMAGLPPQTRAPLTALRNAIAAALPGATEAISYQIPTVKVNGRSLLAYAAFSNHYSLFPMSKSVIASLGEAAAPFVAGKGTLRFALDEAVPATILNGVIAARLAELEASKKER